jgi:hypothetical protein
MSVEIVHCPNCKTRVSWFDQYCGSCGQALARLRWKQAGGEWRTGRCRLPVRPGEGSARVIPRTS